jgi:dTDP-4-amino-4,6-dideoxy-D-glucose transaminase
MTPVQQPTIKRSVGDLALFGGPPLFSRPRPIGQLHTSRFDRFREKLRAIYDSRWLSNDGPMVKQLEETLASRHGVVHCIALTNAGLGIMMLMRVLAKGRRGEVVMPAFTFRGLPHFAVWAGQTPAFCDVDPHTHTLEPRALRARISPATTCVLAVANPYAVGDREELCAVAQRCKVPIFFDSVYGFGATYKGSELGSWGVAEVFSLHATKALNGFEGGYVTTNDDHIAKLLRMQRNFALGADPDLACDHPHVLGLNAKLNELHAAMALACLEDLPRVFAENQERYQHYRQAFAQVSGMSILRYPDDPSERQNFQMVIAELGADWPLSREETLRLFRAEGMAVNAHFGPALHQSRHFPPGAKAGPLPVSEWLARRFVQLPSGSLVDKPDIDATAALCAFIRKHAGDIGSRLSATSAAAVAMG